MAAMMVTNGGETMVWDDSWKPLVIQEHYIVAGSAWGLWGCYSIATALEMGGGM
jgi:hypothetical protein